MATATVNLGGGTISAPDLYQNLFIVSKVIRRHIREEDGYLKNDKDTELEYLFDLDNFIQKELKTCFASVGIGLGPCVYVQRRKRSSAPVPTADQINNFLSRIFRKLSLSVECAIVALLYAERLMSQGKIAMNGRNWRPILLASILMASKMWDDLSSWNIEFAELFPIFNLNEINQLEKLFLQEINYNLFISGTEYARYYFALRGLKYTHEHKIPRHYLDFQMGGRSLEEQTRIGQEASEKNVLVNSPKSSPVDYGTAIPTKSMQIPGLTSSEARSRFSNIPDFAESLREESLRVNRSLRRLPRDLPPSKVGIFHAAEPPVLILDQDKNKKMMRQSSKPQVIEGKRYEDSHDPISKVLDPGNDDNQEEDIFEDPLSQLRPFSDEPRIVDSNDEFILSFSPSLQSGNEEELSRTYQTEEDLKLSL